MLSLSKQIDVYLFITKVFRSKVPKGDIIIFKFESTCPLDHTSCVLWKMSRLEDSATLSPLRRCPISFICSIWV